MRATGTSQLFPQSVAPMPKNRTSYSESTVVINNSIGGSSEPHEGIYQNPKPSLNIPLLSRSKSDDYPFIQRQIIGLEPPQRLFDSGNLNVAGETSFRFPSLLNVAPVTSDVSNDGSGNVQAAVCNTIESHISINESELLEQTQVQKEACIDIDTKWGIGKCLDCAGYKATVDQHGPLCRFLGFRKLSYVNNNPVAVVGFAHPIQDSTLEDKDLWMPCQHGVPDNVVVRTSEYILGHVIDTFTNLVKSERKHTLASLNNDASPVWKRPVPGLRETCDVCNTSLFNVHWICPECGFSACVDCYKNATSKKNAKVKTRSIPEDENRPQKCHKSRHSFDTLILTQLIPGECVTELELLAHKVCHVFMIPQNCSCSLRSLEDCVKSDLGECPTPDCKRSKRDGNLVMDEFGSLDACGAGCDVHTLLSPGQLLTLEDHRDALSIRLFETKWAQGEPVVIRNVHNSVDKNLWTPERFSQRFGDEPCDFVNCIDGKTVTGHNMRDFWDGFSHVNDRLPGKDGSRMLLKLKDWPSAADFAEKCPEWYHDLMKCIPMSIYTTRTGRRNLVATLPSEFLPPDLGPKLYIAYPALANRDMGTTKLHVDVSDAINVVLHVGVPTADTDNTSHYEDIRRTLLQSQADAETVERALANMQDVGAIWHIYAAKDADEIRAFLTKVRVKKNKKWKQKPNSDHIHDQNIYLTRDLRDCLERDHKVTGFTIIQFVGDAILIPAGAPHQVKNLNSCIKAALDFVSPEHVDKCVQLTKDFRGLSKGHTNNEDKLQIHNLIYHAVKHAVTMLQCAPTCEQVPWTDMSNTSLDAIAGDSDMSSNRAEATEDVFPPSVESLPAQYGELVVGSGCDSDDSIVKDQFVCQSSDCSCGGAVLQPKHGFDTVSECYDGEINNEVVGEEFAEGNISSSVEDDETLVVGDKSCQKNGSSALNSTKSSTSHVINENAVCSNSYDSGDSHSKSFSQIETSTTPEVKQLKITKCTTASLSTDDSDIEKEKTAHKKKRKREYDRARRLQKRLKPSSTTPETQQERDLFLEKKAARKEYDKIRNMKIREEKLKKNPIVNKASQVETWKQMLVAQNKVLRPNPDIRVAPPQVVYDLQTIKRYTEGAMDSWVKDQGFELQIVKSPEQWRRTPDLAFYYKGCYYYICPYCTKKPELGIPNNKKQNSSWSEHVLGHKKLPCYDMACNLLFKHPAWRAAHMKKIHFKPPTRRPRPVVTDNELEDTCEV